MINIDQIERQAQSLQACINNYKAACGYLREVENNRLSKVIDHVNAHNLVTKTEKTIIGQLKLINIQNQDLLK